MLPFKEQPPTPHFPSSLSTSLPTSANILPPPPPQAVTLLLQLLAHICWATALTKYCAKNNICIRACNLKPKPKLVTPLKNKDWDTEVKSCKAGMQFGFCFLSQVSETAPINHRSYPQHTLTDSRHEPDCMKWDQHGPRTMKLWARFVWVRLCFFLECYLAYAQGALQYFHTHSQQKNTKNHLISSPLQLLSLNNPNCSSDNIQMYISWIINTSYVWFLITIHIWSKKKILYLSLPCCQNIFKHTVTDTGKKAKVTKV